MNQKPSQVLTSARTVASSVDSWADLSNALFNPVDGLLIKAYPTREEREAFLKTKEYGAIRALLEKAIDETGLVGGATPKKSGKFIVRLPKTLHAALEREAGEEGVSLNQLVVTKLAVQMSKLASGPHADMAAIAQAYLETRDGYSTDRVIADPEMNRRFLRRCRELGLAGTDCELNWKLFNARKNRGLSNMPKTRRYTAKGIDDFEFSSEIALVYVKHEMKRREDRVITLDKILCDPELAAFFDGIAERLAPGFTPLEYRWAALGVRKAAGRNLNEALKKSLPDFDVLGSTKSVRPSKIPTEQGIYVFRCEDQSLYISHTDNLRNRIERHLESSDSRGVPDWLYDSGRRAIRLGIVPLPTVTTTQRRLIEQKAVAKYKPLLNVPAVREKKDHRSRN